MGSIFRSEPMSLCQLYIQPEAAFLSLSELGELGVVQFRDLNSESSALQRRFITEVRRCDEMERQLNFIQAELEKDEIAIPAVTDDNPRAPMPREMIDLEAQIERDEEEIKELSANASQMEQSFLEYTEFIHALEKSKDSFNHTQTDAFDEPIEGPLDFVVGVMNRERFLSFERMIWRIGRGNIFVRQIDIEEPFKDPKTKRDIYKIVFVLFFQGEQLKSRVKKICGGYHATLYPVPHEQKEWNEAYSGAKIRLADLTLVINQTKDERKVIMSNIARNLIRWRIMVKKMKAIYHTLNYFNMDLTNKCMIGECWIATNDIPKVQDALIRVSSASDSEVKSFLQTIKSAEVPPTFMRTNKFTQGFQNLIDSYGHASYQEVNPALYTIITFPFLFGIMFGDVGHGIIIFLFALWMVLFEERLSKWKAGEIFDIFFGGRYIILLMGIFGMYAGFIYNDLFSKSMNIFGSQFYVNRSLTEVVRDGIEVQLDPRFEYSGDAYPLGLDPAWQVSTNKIIFHNTIKMKLSIIIGVLHMLFGVCMSLPNHFHLKRKMNVILEFIPQFLFLVCLFGYMVFMIFFKWTTYGPHMADPQKGSSCAPSILIYFIDMILQRETKTTIEGCTNAWMYENQQGIQQILVLVGLLCIPWLLLGKILYVWYLNKSGVKDHNYGHPGEPMSEVAIYQIIHTIEYILNCISHTASYLRLWALSLAHSQLSDVAWGQLFQIALKSGFPVLGPQGVMIFVLFGAWAAVTVAILVTMEGLSAFLHCLRLHWVEFMSKFYDGKGYPFEPFSFDTLKDEDEGQ
ncbi:V-type proton ATPase 116 kDa subunit a 1-like [Culicoides brevitarsis]|uniref:V-type proton ATPase 116 kDa subunit a 1-like n=1 Tax=Culicoides brevitarsis TaxID=469753 RepID=UPI00307B61E1